MVVVETDRRYGPPRAELRSRVELTPEGSTECARVVTANLSLGGMFVMMRQPLEVGTRAHFTMYLPSGERIFGDATVMWNRGDGDSQGPTGSGMRFDQMPRQCFTILSDAIDAFCREKLVRRDEVHLRSV